MAGLDERLRERVLAKLGFGAPPAADLAGLAALYGRWCRRVPFDNVRKLIHVRSGDAAPLPGSEAEDFFAAWLAHGTGGTCWAGNGALCVLLESLGFSARRGIATMLVAPDLPPNHGTVSVSLDRTTWLVDASILHGEPLPLDRRRETEVAHGAWGVRARPDGAKWLVRWRPQHRPEGLDCRIDTLDGTAADFARLHEATRAWSPFNYSLYLRTLRGERVVGTAFGRHVGISRELAARLPEDLPLAPPPPAGS